MIKIVWDWNGTLLNDANLCLSCINHLLKKNGLAPLEDLRAYREIFGFPIEDYYRKAGFDFEKTPYKDLADDYMADYMSRYKGCALAPDALETLQMSKDYGFDNIILSASSLDHLKEQLEYYSLPDVIDAVYGISDWYAHSKLELAKEFASTCLPEDLLWCVGDTLHDAEIAKAINAKCVLITTGHQSYGRLKTAGVPVTDSLHEALEIIYAGSED